MDLSPTIDGHFRRVSIYADRKKSEPTEKYLYALPLLDVYVFFLSPQYLSKTWL